MQRISLAEQIAQLEDAAPVDFDPENEVTSHDPENDDIPDNTSGARDHYIDVGPSALRKLQDSIADPKYDGVKTSRRQLMEYDDADYGDDETSSEMEHDEDETQELDDEVPSSQSEPETESDVPTVIPGTAVSKSTTLSEEAKHTENLSSTLRKTRDEDRKKGKAVSKQIALWDSLLDARIRLQRAVSAGNRLPPLTDYNDVQPSLVKMLAEAQLLSDELFDLQEELLSTNEAIAPPPRKRRKTDDVRTAQDFASEFREATQVAASVEHIFHPHLIQTLNKWSSKIQAVAPSVLLPSNRNAFSKSSQGLKSASQLVDETLVDHDKVLQRTRIYRGKGSRIGADKGDGGDAEEDRGDLELFDDTDFYHQLLRDVIDARGNGGSEDWMEVQKQKKAKKHVDTKASKGRKLRYEVHDKIQNFMVPVITQASWHEEQIDELFASLLGKGFENSMQSVDDGMDEDASMREQIDAALKSGFRVFG
ncbi:apoptosis-antagonizing transcription factor [Suillus paluster]|uniref:apoptosis-antagonizing transcription factor n=1 Tax=Suillus paluster TaxID=48578 RepID=UPI001B8749AB|nr:apoptosis-antagonizing transcription factor [Suillus paluster]KAG1746746.1 apoptosis-antagonizing transcription factor [Suillus paluster]